MNTTTTQSPAAALAAVIGRLMNGEGLPPADSQDFADLSDLVRRHLATATASEREELGMRVLGLLIDAGRAKVQSDHVLRMFGRDAL